jgi:NAD(P)-dependent dehydrogenase (short-subunit alcohol dehydrogenase family)
MKELTGKVAVVTGGGSGIGRELALACAAEGMKVVLADIDEPGMVETARLTNAQTMAVRCNVAKADDVESLAARVYEAHGATHLLFNNAGVSVAGPTWTTTLQDWEWVMGINLMGVVHGIRAFVPRMLKQGGEAHVVSTASAAGTLSVPGSSVYCVSKHGVVTMSECLHHELRQVKASIGVSVLCPAFVPTGIADSHRNRPADLADTNPLAAPYAAWAKKAVEKGKISAAEVAAMTLEAVKENRFYIFTHPHTREAIEVRAQDLLQVREPTNPTPTKTSGETL